MSSSLRAASCAPCVPRQPARLAGPSCNIPPPPPQVLEHCSGGELLSRTRSGRHYSERTAASFLRAVLRTIAQVRQAVWGVEGGRQVGGRRRGHRNLTRRWCCSQGPALPRDVCVLCLLCLLQCHAKRIIHRDIKPENVGLNLLDISAERGRAVLVIMQGRAAHLPAGMCWSQASWCHRPARRVACVPWRTCPFPPSPLHYTHHTSRLAHCPSPFLLPPQFMFLSDDEAAPLKGVDFGLAVFFDPQQLPVAGLNPEGTPW